MLHAPLRARGALALATLAAAALLATEAGAQVFAGQDSDGTLTLSDVRSAAAPELWIAAQARPPAERPVAPLGALPPATLKSVQAPHLPDQYLQIFRAAAQEHGIAAPLIAAVAAAESAFDARAGSPKGAIGLKQLMPDTARRFKVQDRYSPTQSVRGGAAYLRWLSDRYDNDLDRVLAAYNAGEQAVERAGGMPPFAETRAYVPRVLALLRHYSAAMSP